MAKSKPKYVGDKVLNPTTNRYVLIKNAHKYGIDISDALVEVVEEVPIDVFTHIFNVVGFDDVQLKVNLSMLSKYHRENLVFDALYKREYYKYKLHKRIAAIECDGSELSYAIENSFNCKKKNVLLTCNLLRNLRLEVSVYDADSKCRKSYRVYFNVSSYEALFENSIYQSILDLWCDLKHIRVFDEDAVLTVMKLWTMENRDDFDVVEV